ncbi:hypothetical protein IJH89_02580 [Candidatus Saccharibacteria bacterium]|nr:hypothetical protein [Candidatus Saccharibacteria bacterium]
MPINEEERRARLLKQGAERLPDIKKRFEESQRRNFNSNFAPGGKDEALVPKPAKKSQKPVKAAGKAQKSLKKPAKTPGKTPKKSSKSP